MLSVIGKGSYGKVLLVKKADCGELYALKVLKKSEILRRNQVEHTMTERRILVSDYIANPFMPFNNIINRGVSGIHSL
jgi:serine/threonine protein kinase